MTKTLPGAVADVLLLLPLAKTYSYRIPDELIASVRRGVQVLCPVRHRHINGLVISVRGPKPDDPPLQCLSDVVTMRPPWPEDLIELIHWMSSYYVAPLGVVARTAMPTLFARRVPRSTQAVQFVHPPLKPFKSERMRTILSNVESAGPIPVGSVRRLVPGAADALRRLLATGCVRLIDFDEPAPVPIPMDPGPRLVLTTDQQAAFTRISSGLTAGYRAFLLHGVTGSGKTEVYLRAIERVIEQGKGAIVLVPEIALTFELRRRFERRFGPTVAVLHSAMPEARRVAVWDGALSGRVRVVVGPRSAVFAPVQKLGLVVVDEEHETTYKQQDGLRYHARDVALVRGKMAGCTVVLGSATPALETFNNTHDRKITYLSLPTRVRERPMPLVRFIDLKGHPTIGRERLLSDPMLVALSETVARGESAILFLNRRGFGRFVICRACGQAISCPNCSITLTHHNSPERLRCHYCDHAIALPDRCPTCNAAQCQVLGFGTERVEDEVMTRVPGARCARLDADTATAGGIEAILSAFSKGQSNILVGTQIVAKGHDFPNVTLVGVLLAEQSLAFPDFRAAERTFQLLTQVAGRAGRGDLPGEVLIQTYSPNQYALRFASTHDYLGFAVAESGIRRERGYPPFSYLATIEVSSPDGAEARAVADDIRRALDLPDEGRAVPRKVRILGPATAPIERLRGRSRVQLMLKGQERSAINRLLWRIHQRFGPGRAGVRIVIDVDPTSLS